MKSGGNLNIDCQRYSVNCTKVDMRSIGTVDIDGSQIYLASNTSLPNPPNIPDPQSKYGNTGVTTY